MRPDHDHGGGVEAAALQEEPAAARLLPGRGGGGETVDWTATCINVTVGTGCTIAATLSTYPRDGSSTISNAVTGELAVPGAFWVLLVRLDAAEKALRCQIRAQA